MFIGLIVSPVLFIAAAYCESPHTFETYLVDKNVAAQKKAINQCGESSMKWPFEKAIPLLKSMLTSENEGVRLEAFTMLGAMIYAVGVFDEKRNEIKNPDLNAVYPEIGAKLAPLQSTLSNLLNDTSRDIRKSAAEVMVFVTSISLQAEKRLMEMFLKEDEEIGFAAAKSLMMKAHNRKELFDVMQDIQERGKPWQKEIAVRTLSEMRSPTWPTCYDPKISPCPAYPEEKQN